VLNRNPRAGGFTLIEMMITVAIVSFVIALAAPSFWSWLQNTQIRNGVESMMTGIKLGRIEALKRNATVRFQLMSSLDSTCGLSTSGPNWVVSVDPAAALCNQTDSETTPFIVREKASGEGTANAVYAASQSSINFDPLGRVTPAPGADNTIDVTNPSGGDCVASSGPMRCQRIIVTAGGQARMCDPAVGEPTDPRSC
jgi:type IV fimbrial biogenesis protein FimT